MSTVESEGAAPLPPPDESEVPAAVESETTGAPPSFRAAGDTSLSPEVREDDPSLVEAPSSIATQGSSIPAEGLAARRNYPVPGSATGQVESPDLSVPDEPPPPPPSDKNKTPQSKTQTPQSKTETPQSRRSLSSLSDRDYLAEMRDYRASSSKRLSQSQPASSSQSPPPGAGVGEVDEDGDVYERLQFDAVLEQQRQLLDRMRKQDPNRKGEFTINQVRELWRFLQETNAEHTAPEPSFQKELSRRIVSNKYKIACFSIASILPLFFFLWAAMALVHGTMRSFAVGDSGALVEPPSTADSGDIWPVASADAVALHHLQEFLRMDLGTLHRIRDVVFVHNSVFHHFQVASLIHRNEHDLLLTATDGATLHMSHGHARFKRSYHNEELVDLSETKRYAAAQSDDGWTSCGTFSVQVEPAPEEVS